MAITVKQEMVVERSVSREHGALGARDLDRIAMEGMSVGETLGIVPACSLRQQQRSNVVELIDAITAKSVATSNFYHRVNSSVYSLKDKGKYKIKTVLYPLGEAYENETDREQAIAMLRSAGYVDAELTDQEVSEKNIPIALVTRVS